jgi:bifunctional DNA-binding transcriptional regulator/antitoxin component of YhaV-PrlF toxin-antitoxin module
MTAHESRSGVERGAQGRLVIPVTLRKALKLPPDSRLVARRVGNSLVLERREAIEKRLRGRFAHVPADEH